MKQICRLLFLLLVTIKVNAQTGTDSSVAPVKVTDTFRQQVKDTVAIRPKKRIIPPIINVPDSNSSILLKDTAGNLMMPPVADSPVVKKKVVKRRREAYKNIILRNPWYNFRGEPMAQMAARRGDIGKESQFYLLCGVVLFFALIKTLFGKYLQNMFAVFFRISMKQKQLREQLLQMPLPSLLLNLLFIITGAIYASYLMRFHGAMNDVNQWLLILYCAAGLILIYLVKLLVLKLTGWIFNMTEATDTYIFVVFLVNKLLGIFLLPFILFMAFSDSRIVSVVITLSYITIFLFFSYRYLISYSAVRKEIKVSPFHFFLYLCAFEIIPLVLIYKVLLEFVYRSP